MRARGNRPIRLVVIALVILLAGWIVVDALRDWSLSDMQAYWNAATRLRDGEPLYATSYSTGAHDLYRYAPWFAWAWVPLTLLPRQLVEIAWELILALASIAAILPTLRKRSLAATLLAVLMGSLLLWTVAKANAHALVVIALIWGVNRRSGPLWVALAASLKAAPLAFALVYVGRRQWARAAVTLALTSVLVVPMLAYDLSGYATDPGLSGSLWSLVGFVPWLVAAGAGALLSVALARGRFAWLGGSVASVAAMPRLLDYDVTFFLVASASVEPTPDSTAIAGEPPDRRLASAAPTSR